MESIKITLAGNEYEIAQLTLRQLRDLSAAALSPDGENAQDTVRRSYDRTVATIAVALRVAHPQITADALLDLPGVTGSEMRAANDAVLRFSGLIPPKPSLEELRAQLTAIQQQIADAEKEGAVPGEG